MTEPGNTSTSVTRISNSTTGGVVLSGTCATGIGVEGLTIRMSSSRGSNAGRWLLLS
jgi:hypothetical protein